MPDALPSTTAIHRDAQPQAERRGLHLYTALLDKPDLTVAMDVAMEALEGVAMLVSHVPICGPVGDDRGVIASRDVELDESLALALWWNSPAGCAALAAMPAGGLVEHGFGRRVAPALRHAVTLIVATEHQGFCAVTLWRAAGARGLSPREALLLQALSPHLVRAIDHAVRHSNVAS